MVPGGRDPPHHGVRQAASAARRQDPRASACVAAEGLRRRVGDLGQPPALVVRDRASPGERRRFAVAVPLLLRPARGCRDADLALRRAPRQGQVRPASLRRFRRRVLRHVRRGLAALRAEDGNRRRQDESPLAADCVELLSPPLRDGLEPLPQLPRHRPQHHRPRSATGGFRRLADLLQRSGASGQRSRRPQLARRLPDHACTSRTTYVPCARQATSS